MKTPLPVRAEVLVEDYLKSLFIFILILILILILHLILKKLFNARRLDREWWWFDTQL